ncbi:MAG: polysaccharide biosynthesis/export family protein, partial [bacterium]
ISVWRNEQLSREVVVRPDGKISSPLLDELAVAGLTPLEVKEIITQKLALYIEDPEVTVILQGINSHKVYITGNAGLPGVLNLTRTITLFQLLAMADGKALSENVDLDGAYILRDRKRLPVDFEKLVEEGDLTQDVELLPDDIISLPDNYRNRITVIGEVKTPRVVPFKRGTTLLDAVLLSGGPTEDANLNGTKIIRKKTDKEQTAATAKDGSADKEGKRDEKRAINKKGEGDKKGAADTMNKKGEAATESATEVIKVRLRDIMKKGDLKDNLELQPMDIIIIPASIF